MDDPRSYLLGLEQFGIKFGLENMQALTERLGHPERAFRSVHIAGTNGKGSVTAMIDAGLRAAGHRSARYTSPHLVDLSERFTINGQAVDAAALADAVRRVRGAIGGLLDDGGLRAQPTFFEVTTAAAFEMFRAARVEIAVLEVGLGGRLDATNVVGPQLTAITSIALDHERYLGSTLGDIAREKAGIIKPGVPVVIGPLPPEAFDAIDQTARERDAPLISALDGVEATVTTLDTPDAAWGTTLVRLRTARCDYGTVRLGLRGLHQVTNAVIAVRALELLDVQGVKVSADSVLSALAEPSWPGRLDLQRLSDGREVLLDAAHNPAGAVALASYLQSRGIRLPLVFAAMRDKDTEGMLRVLLPAVERLVVTRASNPRSADPEALADEARRVAPHLPVAITDSIDGALVAAWRGSRRIVVAGSIFLIGDVIERIGRS